MGKLRVMAPSGDVVLMHRLMLAANEDEYLKVAQRFR